MSWVKSDDNEPLHPKIFRAGALGYAFFQAAKCFCSRNLTDGFIPSRELPLVLPSITPRTAVKAAVILVECGLFDVKDDGYLVHDYLEYNPSRIEVLERRAERAESGRVGGLRKASNRLALARATLQTPAKLTPAPARPVPVPEEEELNTLVESGRLDVTRLNGNSHRPAAIRVLEFLNAKAGRNFRPTRGNIALIESRLRAGATEEDCRGVIVRKHRAWSTDPKMATYLRPATLFNATKFDQYIGEQGMPS